MSSFKCKPSKVKHLNNTETLDTIHKKHINDFDTKKNNLTRLKTEKSVLDANLLSLDISKFNNIQEFIKKRSQMQDDIQKLENEIYDIDNNISELDYYSKINDILFDYYDDNNKASDNKTSDNKANINNNNNTNNTNNKPVPQTAQMGGNAKLIELEILSQQTRKPKKEAKRRMRKNDKNDIINILNFFGNDNKDNTDNTDNTINNIQNTDNTKDNNNKIEYIVSNKATLFNNYMKILNNISQDTDKKTKLLLCDKCGIEKILLHSEGIRVCNKCGEVEYIIMESDIPSHKDSVTEKIHYPYKRINHLCEWLNQFQAKESTEIEEYIINDIKNELKKMKIVKTKNITIKIVKDILKKLKYSEYYGHIVYIVSRLTGRPSPNLSREMEEKIKYMFKQIQEPFMRHCPSSRINFLSYSYVLHKIFQILNLTEYLQYFELLKSREKLQIQEEIWEKICNDLNWPFHTSMNV